MSEQRIAPRVVGAIIATGLMSFSGVIVETAMNITFPTLMREFGVTTSTVQWLTTLYLLIVAAIVPLSAVLKRTFKMRQLFVVANLLFLLGLTLDATAPAFWVLLLGRAVQGLGTGIALPLMFNIILEQVPRSKIGMMMGVGTLITGIAPAIGPTFGGLVATMLSWRFIFIFLLPLLVGALVLGVVCVHQSRPLAPQPVDGLSIGLIVVAFAGLIFGVSHLGTAPLLSWASGGAMGLGALALAGFAWRSLRLAQPIVALTPFKQAAFSLRVLAFVLIQMIALGLSFVLPNYLQLVNGASALQAGLIVLPGAALGAVLAPLSGRLYDHLGARRPILIGSTVVVLGMGAFVLAGRSLSDGMIIGAYVTFMLGIGLAFGNLLTDTLAQLPQALQADGNAIMTTLQQFAAALGTSLVAAVVAAGQADRAQVPGTALGAQWALWLLFGFALAGWGLLIWTQRTHQKS